jgi:hypothetical protein
MTSTSLADLRQSLTGAVIGPADWSELQVGGECVLERGMCREAAKLFAR